MTRTKAAFDVVKNKLMKNIEERAGNLKAPVMHLSLES